MSGAARGMAVRMVLEPQLASDMMTPRPISIRHKATIREAVATLLDRGISAAPVIDNAGRPIGVISRSDIVAHDRETVRQSSASPTFYDAYELQSAIAESGLEGFQIENVDTTLVEEIMTPVVFSVSPSSTAEEVVALLMAKKVHRLFVVDDQGILVGVISTLDVLRRLRAE